MTSKRTLIGIGALCVIALAAVWRQQSGSEPQQDAELSQRPGQSTIQADADVPESRVILDEEKDPTSPIPLSPAPSDEDVSVSEELLRLPVIAEWRTKGVTDEDLLVATKAMKANGFPEFHWSDPALILQFLPRRDIPVLISGAITIAEKAEASKPVPFAFKGFLPEASVEFQSWKFVRDGDRIIIHMLGYKSGKPAPAVQVPVEVEGFLPLLDAGTYTVIMATVAEPEPHQITLY